MNEWFKRNMDEWMNEKMIKLVHSINCWMKEFLKWTNEWINRWMNSWTCGIFFFRRNPHFGCLCLSTADLGFPARFRDIKWRLSDETPDIPLNHAEEFGRRRRRRPYTSRSSRASSSASASSTKTNKTTENSAFEFDPASGIVTIDKEGKAAKGEGCFLDASVRNASL